MARALEGLPGIERVETSFFRKMAAVSFNPDLVNVKQMGQALSKKGLVAKPRGNPAPLPAGDEIPPPKDTAAISGEGLVCHCFGHTQKDIEQDFLENGRSKIIDRIASAKKEGGCDCAQKNPKGR